jgi:CRISPR-associated protein Csm2
MAIQVSFNGTVPLEKLFDEKALEQAKQFPDIKRKRRDRSDKRTELSKSQIRRFFGEVKNLQIKHKQSLDKDKSWIQIKPMVMMLKSKAFYAEGTNKIPKEFKEFIVENISKVNTKEEFETFVNYFEAVLAFAYGEEKIGN